MGGKISSLITQISSFVTHHPITHFLSFKNTQISPKPGYVFKSKNSKMWDPHSEEVKKDGTVVMWLCRWGCSCGSKCSLESLVGSTKKSCGFDSSLTVGLTDVRVFTKLPLITHHPIW